MKLSKVFGCVLGLHFCVITVLLVQPGCRTRQAPTQSYRQEGTVGGSADGSVQDTSPTPAELVQATGLGASGQGLDSAFNAGFEGGDDAPENEFSEFESVAPIEPIIAEGQVDQTVQVSGPAFETYTVKKGDNLWSIAKRNNVSLTEIYTANGLDNTSVLRIGQQIQIPVDGGSATVNTVTPDTYQPTSFNQASTTYTVRSGDSLSKIANQYDTTVSAIKAANNKTKDLIRVGEKLVIPVTSAVSNGTASTATKASNSTTTSGTSALYSEGQTHTVKSGEFPGTIARKYGMSVGDLLSLNSISDPRKLQVGQVLKIKGLSTSTDVDLKLAESVVAEGPVSITSNLTGVTAGSAPSTVPTTITSPVGVTVVEADTLIEEEMSEIGFGDDIEAVDGIRIINAE